MEVAAVRHPGQGLGFLLGFLDGGPVGMPNQRTDDQDQAHGEYSQETHDPEKKDPSAEGSSSPSPAPAMRYGGAGSLIIEVFLIYAERGSKTSPFALH